MARRLEGRDGEIWRLFCRGTTQEALAEKFGISQPRVSQIISAIRDSIPIQERVDIVKQEVDFLAGLRAEVLELWDSVPAPMVAGPRAEIVKDENGNTVQDHTGRLAALARAESLTARLHRVLGLDAPAKLDLNLQGEEEAARRAAAEALTRLHGGTDTE